MPHGEESSRFEEKERRSGWGVAPPSRHLWVGNLSHHVTKSALFEQFLRFGDIDNISYVPGRNFAFVNYRKQEDAIIAMRGLQGFSIAGMPLRIEFAKGVSHVNLCLFPLSRAFVFSVYTCMLSCLMPFLSPRKIVIAELNRVHSLKELRCLLRIC